MTTHSESSGLRAVAEDAARAVTPMLLDAFRTAMSVTTKRDAHDIVTIHDRASEQALAAAIRAAVPDSAIVGEEGGVQGAGRVVWHVDPIDGTTNFARGLAEWCISIGVEVDGRLVAGVIHAPARGETTTADLSGAWKNGQPIIASARPTEEEAVLLTSFPNARHFEEIGAGAYGPHRRLVERFRALRNLGSGAIHLAAVAAGEADAMLGFATNPWDIAAGVFILEQAGGRFLGLSGGEDVAAAHWADDFIATGAGGDYPTLAEIGRDISRRMPIRYAGRPGAGVSRG
jgi:myo-inositol-1(or 4)-monophosphatase